MQHHQLVQGSPEWHAYRAQHFNASDAPAMLGVSLYKTRAQLLDELSTGIAPEVDAGTQRRFDDGHRFEALARPLAEQIIGEELFPVVGSEGRLSASFDGLTMLEDVAFEHKSLNDDLREVFDDIETVAPEYRERKAGGLLPLHYRVQMEQQCMVSGAERVLFMATKWQGDALVEARHCWYYRDPALAEAITLGWEQFAQDLAAHVPAERKVAATGRAPESLPALRIEVRGQVASSNLEAFKEHALAVFKGISRELSTDQDFADAEKTVKWCGEVEDRLAAAKQHALSQTEDIDALFRTIDAIGAEARSVRLDLEKLVKARKDAIRAEIISEARSNYDTHILALNQRIGHQPALLSTAQRSVPDPDFAGAIKGKRTIEGLRNAVDTTLASAKVEASSIANRVELNLAHYRSVAADRGALFPDLSQLALKPAEDFEALVLVRISDADAQEAKRRADAEAKRLADLQAISESAKAAANDACGIPAPAVEHPRPVAVPPAAPRTVAAAAPTLKLGDICDRLGFTVTADFLASLGFQAHVERNAKLYRESDFSAICDAIIARVQEAQRIEIGVRFARANQAA